MAELFIAARTTLDYSRNCMVTFKPDAYADAEGGSAIVLAGIRLTAKKKMRRDTIQRREDNAQMPPQWPARYSEANAASSRRLAWA